MKLKEWLNEWLDKQVRITSKERTYKKYRGQAEKYIIPILGDYDLGSLTQKEMYEFSSVVKAKGLSSSTINCIITILKSAWKAAMIMGFVSKPIANVIIRPPVMWKKTECFTNAEQQKIEKYIFGCNDPKLFGILLSLYTGLRIGELLALTWEDIDLKKGTMSINKSCHDCWVNGNYFKIIDETKTTSSERIIPLPRQILYYMRELKRKTKSKFVVVGKSIYGAQIRSYQRTFEHMLIKLNIKKKCFHSLRHTFATRALEVGMDVKTLSEILGHKNPMITLRRYAHSLMEHKAEMMNRVGQILNCEIQKKRQPICRN